jgi:ubiquitin carboxyl-terminal hydrolase 5/13
MTFPPLLTLIYRRSRFTTFPDILVIHAKKFQLVNWVPTKLDIPINLPPSDTLSLDKYIGKGLQATEVELPEDKPGKDTPLHFPDSVLNLDLNPEGSAGLPAFNAEAMAQLEGMGFPTVRCQKALLATGNADPTAAMEWLFAHMEDAGMVLPKTVVLLKR